MNNTYDLINNFSIEKAKKEDIENLYVIMQELEEKANENKDEIQDLIKVYLNLKYYDKAYKCYVKTADKTNKKDRKILFELKDKSKRYGDRLAILKTSEVDKSFIGNIPKFKYCPDTISTNIFTIGGKIECDCCHKTVDVYYDGSFYSIEDVDCLCPDCIKSGEAAKKFDGQFQQDVFDDENVTNAEYRDEILHRTPAYITWQGTNWPAHCDDYCEFLGDASYERLEELGIENDFINYSGFDREDLKEFLAPSGSVCGYLFRCLKCGKYILCADCD